jgi:hypothetical protein
VQAGGWTGRSTRFGLLAVLTLFTFAGFTFAGCGGGSGNAAAPAARPSTSATLQIVAPGPNQRTGAAVDVALRLDGAHLAPAGQVGGILRPDQGHIHLSVDGQLVAMPGRLDARLPVLTAGSHTLEAEFVASDHLPFSNRVVAAVTFAVR